MLAFFRRMMDGPNTDPGLSVGLCFCQHTQSPCFIINQLIIACHFVDGLSQVSCICDSVCCHAQLSVSEHRALPGTSRSPRVRRFTLQYWCPLHVCFRERGGGGGGGCCCCLVLSEHSWIPSHFSGFFFFPFILLVHDYCFGEKRLHFLAQPFSLRSECTRNTD